MEVVHIGFVVREEIPMTKNPLGLTASTTVAYALNLFFPRLWNTRLETARS
jgi:hypothetical protein